MAGLDEDDGPQAYFAQDGGEVDAGVDAVGLARVPHLVEEAYVLHVGGGRRVGGAGDGGVGEAAQQRVVPDGQHLLLYVGFGAGLVALEAGDDALREGVGEDLRYLGVLLVDVGGEEEARVDYVVVAVAGLAVVAEREGAFVDGADVDVEVADVGLLVVDVAGEGQVEGTVLADETQAVVFPFDGGGEGVGLAAGGEDFLEDGDVVEVGGVDDDAQHGVVGGGGDGEGERRVERRRPAGIGERCAFLAEGQDEGGVEVAVEEGVDLGGEVHFGGVVLLVLLRGAAGGEEQEEKDE